MAEISDSLVEAIAKRLRGSKRVRRRIGKDGWLHIDHPVPFLCVYRLPEGRADPGTSRLVLGEGSYLVARDDPATADRLRRLVSTVVEAFSEQFKAILVLELWSGLPVTFAGGALVGRPCFRIVVPQDEAARAPAAALARALRRGTIFGQASGVDIVRRATPGPPKMPPLLTPGDAKRLGALTIGLEAPPVYQDLVGGGVYPRVLRQVQRDVSVAIRKASFRFAHLQTSHRPEHFLTFGQRVMLRAVREADLHLADVGDAFDLLLAVTPVNADEAEVEFRAGRLAREPRFQYRLLNFDPDVLKRRLYGVALELIEDPALGELMRDKREELDRQITLLHDRNTENFLYGSLQLYGGVDDQTFALAERILAATGCGRSDGSSAATLDGNHDDEKHLDAEAFAARALEEIAWYGQAWPGLTAGVEIRDDVPGLLVSRGRLLVSRTLKVPIARVEPLIHHEVGTHVLTWHNATAQPLKLLAAGLPGYDELQEGTAVMAEHLVGGLQPRRLRLLAARVLAVRRLIERRTFSEIFSELRDGHRFGRRSAFTTTMRVFRGGGFTKDAIYLRGLARLLSYLANGGELELLFLGKVSEQSLAVVRELRWRGVLRAAPLRPRFLDLPGAAERLERLRRGATVLDLLEERI